MKIFNLSKFIGLNKLRIAWTGYLNVSTVIFPLHSVQVVYHGAISNGCYTSTSACTYTPGARVLQVTRQTFWNSGSIRLQGSVTLPQWRQGTVIDFLACTPRRRKLWASGSNQKPSAGSGVLQTFHLRPYTFRTLHSSS